VEEKPAGRRAGVNGISKAPKLDALLVQIADQIDQLLDRPAKPAPRMALPTPSPAS